MSASNDDRAFVGRRPTHRASNKPGSFLAELDNPAWMNDGLCAQTDPEAFFPDKGGSTRDAKAVCMTCTVRTQCLDYALEHEERFGIWGGLSERERRKLAKGGLVVAGPRICKLASCEDHLPITAHGAAKYCTPEHAQLAVYERAQAHRAARIAASTPTREEDTPA